MQDKNKNYFISFIGGIGSGKTTATELVAKKMDFFPVKERYQKNDFLPLFYNDMKKWALQSQLFFLSEKFNQIMKIKQIIKRKSVVLDVDINQDLCFAEAQKELGNINDKEYLLYHKIYKTMAPFLPKPDLIIYLKSDPVTLNDRIDSRGRNFEKKIPPSYSRFLLRAQDKWVRKNKDRFAIITVDSGKINFVNNVKDKEKFINLIKSHL